MRCDLRAIPIIAALALAGCGDGIQDAPSSDAETAFAGEPIFAADGELLSCSAAEHSQFDFLVGAWNTSYEDEEPFAEFEIEKSPDGCTLHGVGKYTDGDTRTFFGYYDPGVRRWKQMWISGRLLLELQGAADSQSRQLAGTLYMRADTPEPISARLTHELQADGTIREYLPFSVDGGRSWRQGRTAVWSRKRTRN